MCNHLRAGCGHHKAKVLAPLGGRPRHKHRTLAPSRFSEEPKRNSYRHRIRRISDGTNASKDAIFAPTGILPALSGSRREPSAHLRCQSLWKTAVVDYYKVLKVKQTASAKELKSAYRKLARQRHPDVNGGTEAAARDFALISLAYRTLSDPHERAYYDTQLKRAHNGEFVGSSVFHSNNPHAQRMRRMAVQARFDRVVDRLIEAERRETFALQQAVFTTVTLFLSTFFVAMFKPRLWDSFHLFGRAVMLALFAIGLWHLAVRLKACFEHYTYKPKSIHDSIINSDDEKPDKPFTRFTASTFLILGYAASLGAGLFIGSHAHYVTIFNDLPYLFGQHFRPDLLFYPPIAVLIVDTMHTVASKID
jgi:curved DNA-binding protein CbpA